MHLQLKVFNADVRRAYGRDSTASADYAIKSRNGQQDHGIWCGCARAFCGDGSIAGRAVHRHEHAESGGVSAGLLRKQGMLRHIT